MLTSTHVHQYNWETLLARLHFSTIKVHTHCTMLHIAVSSNVTYSYFLLKTPGWCRQAPVLNALSSRWQEQRSGTGGASAHMNSAAPRHTAAWKAGQTRHEYASRHRGIQRAVSARQAARHTVGRPAFGNVYHRPDFEAQQAGGTTGAAPAYGTGYGDMDEEQSAGDPGLWQASGNEWADEHGRRYVVTEAHLPAAHGHVQNGRVSKRPLGPPLRGVQQMGARQTGLQQHRQYPCAAPSSHSMPAQDCRYPEAYLDPIAGPSAPQMRGFLATEDDNYAAPVWRRCAGGAHDVGHSWQEQVPLHARVSTMHMPGPAGSYPRQGQGFHSSTPTQHRAVQSARPSLSPSQGVQGAPAQHGGTAGMAPSIQEGASHRRGQVDEFGVSLDAETGVGLHEEPGMEGPSMGDATLEPSRAWAEEQPARGMMHAC